MQVLVTANQKAFIQQGIASGRYRTVPDALGEALAQWEERERDRARLLTQLHRAETSLERGFRTQDYARVDAKPR